MKTFDVIVIGAGPGGYVAAIRASQLGFKTAIVEKKWLGGVCLNVGCVPSKALLRNAELAHLLRKEAKSFGIKFDNLELDYSEAHKRSRSVSNRLTRGISFLMKKNDIEVIMGSAKLTAKDTVQVQAEDGETLTLKADNIILATGAHAMVIPGMEPDGEKVLDYAQAIMLDKLPESAVIIGGGAIGVEFATVWSGYGVDVHVVEMLPHILPNEDDEAASELAKAFRKRGVKVHAGTKVKSVTKTETGTDVLLESEKGEETLSADVTLVAVGFRPNSQNLGLEEVGVAVNRRGFVEIDERMATSVPGIWAIGDLTGKLLLAHTASAQAVIAAEAIAGLDTPVLDYRMIPRATFTTPQVASFGFTEDQAKEAGFDLKVGKFPFMANGKALGHGDYAGYAKVLTDASDGKLLGASIVGPEASELIPELVLAQANDLCVEDVTRAVHIHPTLSEATLEAALGAMDRAIHG
ncbi:MAG TPA: dihydrolipoyl dehydrogenase [Anaerolineaceae bacterium]|nr:dihydrolipoyl dehydrogenase [Anaerolineaceae bacterium]